MTESKIKYNILDIAIVGISGQFPESKDHREFWQHLKEGKDLIRTFTEEELLQSGVAATNLQSEKYVRSTGVLPNKTLFDNGFFGYTNAEASIMDPQIRLFHEHCWKALEDAGYTSATESHRIGVFAGAAINENWKLHSYAKRDSTAIDPFYFNIITSHNFIHTLVSYKLNLRGPAYYVDTACSTSLAAVHLACRSLVMKECSMAIAGGVYVNSRKKKGYFYQEGMIASRDGRCRTFDIESSGCASGEGIGIVVLKPMNEALKDRDHIYAVIRSSFVNNDGNNKVGYTAPSVKGQSECIITAQKLAGIDPGTISYIEAHGTATKLGDPIEISALNKAFGVDGSDKFCAIGSVKSNMGHLDTAAGIAGLIKTALSLKNKQIPASLHFTQPNPEIDFDGGPFYVNTRLQDWLKKGDTPRRAGVNSLGIGGTNVHVILEEAPDMAAGSSHRHYQLFTLSAKSEQALLRYFNHFKQFILSEPDIEPADMSYTLQVGRKHFGYRRSIVYKDRNDLLAAIDQVGEQQIIRSSERKQPIVFMFPGQGSQYVNMCKGLYDQESSFRSDIDKGLAIIATLTNEQFDKVLFAEEGNVNLINNTRYTQPLIFLIEVSLAKLLMAYGIVPDYMIGHSIGEYAAACISGVLTLEDGLALVVKRAALMSEVPAGEMISVSIKATDAAQYVNDQVALAAVNAPGQVVLSGSGSALQPVMQLLEEQEIPYVKLHTSHAFHSAMLDPVLPVFKKQVMNIKMGAIGVPFISNLTGRFITEQDMSSVDYWLQHMRGTVEFSKGLKTLLEMGHEPVFVEVGPGHALSSLLKQHQSPGKRHVLNVVRPVKDTIDDSAYFVKRLGELWSLGISINWNTFYKEEQRYRVSLPTYPFEPVQYVAEVDPLETLASSGFRFSKKNGPRHLEEFIYYPTWKRSVARDTAQEAAEKKYLLFAPSAGFTASIIKALKCDEGSVVEVLTGNDYVKYSNRRYVLSATEESNFRSLFSDLREDGFLYTDIIYTWGVCVRDRAPELHAADADLNLCYFNLVRIAKAAMNGLQSANRRLWILTDNLHRVIGTEKIRYTQSLQLGIINVLLQETMLACTNIDVDMSAGAGSYMQTLATELMSKQSKKQHIVALRYGQRWVRDFEKNTRPVVNERQAIRYGGIYLITGGLGNLGFLLASNLLRKYQVTLILAGRKNLENGSDNDEGNIRLRSLQQTGERVHYFSTDITRCDELKALVESVESGFGKIDGVIHAAGVSDHGYFELIEDTTPENVLAMLAPKVSGLINLYETFRNRKPDFVLVTSSVAAVLGGLGYSSYAAANLFMDHFITSINDELPQWRSIQLAEMAFTPEESVKKPDALHPHEINALFEWTAATDNIPVILETVVDLDERLVRTYESERAPEPVAENAADTMLPKSERPDLSSPYEAPGTETESRLKALFEAFFGIEGIGVNDDFYELGGDSLKGMMLLKKIRNTFEINFPLKDFLMQLTIRSIAAKVDDIIWLGRDVEMENEIKI